MLIQPRVADSDGIEICLVLIELVLVSSSLFTTFLLLDTGGAEGVRRYASAARAAMPRGHILSRAIAREKRIRDGLSSRA